MRIADKSSLLKQAVKGIRMAFVLILAGIPLAAPTEASATEGIPSPPPGIAMPPASATAAPASTPASVPPQVPVPPPAAVAAAPQAEPPKAPGADMAKTLTAMEEKVSENAKAVVKSLDTATTDPVMLEELNSARQTVARIEAMIDIEKHMAELDKLRNDRGGVHNNSVTTLANALPASVLAQPLPLQEGATAEMGEGREVHRSGSTEISRIMGSEGRYVAVLKLASGDLKAVKAGDHVSDKTVVRSISSSSVELDENGEIRTLHIKNIDAIYSAMR